MTPILRRNAELRPLDRRLGLRIQLRRVQAHLLHLASLASEFEFRLEARVTTCVGMEPATSASSTAAIVGAWQAGILRTRWRTGRRLTRGLR